MSTNDPIFNSPTFQTNGQWTTHQGSTLAGAWTAQNYSYCPPQQHNESADSYATRQAADAWYRNSNGS